MVKIFLKNNVFNPDIRNKRFKSFFIEIFNWIYFSESKAGLIKDWGNKYTRTWLDLITRFFGLPFFSVSSNAGLKPFLIDFSGWDEKKFLLPINIIRASFIFLFNLLLIVPRFLLNALKLVTEFIPGLIMRLTNDWINDLIDNLKPRSRCSEVVKFFSFVPLIVLFPLHFAFKLVYLVGRATTSPDKSLYAAWKAGEELAGDGILGKVVGVFFCLISILITTLMYLIIFPLTIKLAITSMPAAIVTKIQNVLQFFAPLAKLGAPFSTIVTPIFKAMGVSFAKAGLDVLLGIAALVGMTVGLSVIFLDKILDKVNEGLIKFSAWWRQRELNKKNQRAVGEPVWPVNQNHPQPLRMLNNHPLPQRQNNIPKKVVTPPMEPPQNAPAYQKILWSDLKQEKN